MRPTQQRSAEVAVEAEGLALEAQRAEQADAEAVARIVSELEAGPSHRFVEPFCP